MSQRDLIRHAREFKGYLDRHQYELTDDGILFPKAHALAAGLYIYDTNGENEEQSPNLIPTAALNHYLDVALGDTAKEAAWYLALFSGNYTPVAGLTAASFAAAATEITSATEGYTEGTRPVWTPAAASAGAKSNYASKATFTIATATSLTIRGAALISSSVKGGAGGVLISATRFANDRVEYNGNAFNLGYRATLTAV